MNVRAAILSMFRRAVLVGSTEVATGLQRLRAMAGEDIEDDIEHAEPYGLAAAPPPGAHVFLAQLGGDGASTVALMACDGTLRPTGLTAGDVALYDATGKRVTLSVAGILLGTGATKGVARTTDTVTINVTALQNPQLFALLTAASTAAEIISGVPGSFPVPATITGTITGGSATVKAVD